jgi:hypothetical protein
MPVLTVPNSLTGITINTTSRPIVNNEITVTDAEAAVMVPQQFQPKIVRADLATGDCVIQLPLVVNSLTIGVTPYGADAQGRIGGIGPLAAVSFLKWDGAKVFEYARA